jgi:hypothetical protein
MAIEFPLAIRVRRPDGLWAIDSMKGLTLRSESASDERYFLLRGNVELMTNNPNGRYADVLSLFGTTDYLMVSATNTPPFLL